MSEIGTPVEKANLALLQALDYRIYAYAFDPEDYTRMAQKGTMMSLTAMVDAKPVGFAIWERGPRNKPSHIVRFGVLPHVRRRGIGRQMLGWITNDLWSHGKRQLRSVLSQITCLGPNDPDDVSVFMQKTGFKWVGTNENLYFHYGRWEDGLVFEKDLCLQNKS